MLVVNARPQAACDSTRCQIHFPAFIVLYFCSGAMSGTTLSDTHPLIVTEHGATAPMPTFSTPGLC